MTMSHEKQTGDSAMQSNRHLKEWKDNLDRERQSQYELRNKQKREREQSRLEELPVDRGAALRIQQVDEVKELAHQQEKTRLAIQTRHQKEKSSL